MSISPPANGQFGIEYRGAWPQYKGQDADEVMGLLKNNATNDQLFKQPPGPRVIAERNHIEQDFDFNDDIWLYTDEDNKVAIIPKRGIQHDSPISGLEELVGKSWRAAVKTIIDQIIGVRIVNGIGNVTVPTECDRNRIILRTDGEGKVAEAPRLG